MTILLQGSAFKQNHFLAVPAKDSKEGETNPGGGREFCHRAFCSCFSGKTCNRGLVAGIVGA